MKIIKLTKLHYKTINPTTKSGWDNKELQKRETILFNTNKMVSAIANTNGTTEITHKRAMISSFTCEETIEQIYDLINNN